MKLNTETKKKMLALKNLGLTDEEIIKVIEDDEKIDKGEKLFELPEELEKGAKKARMSGNTKGYTKANREKKVDNDKRFLIETLELALSPFAENVEIANPEREMTFTHNGKKYKIVLSCPRSQRGQFSFRFSTSRAGAAREEFRYLCTPTKNQNENLCKITY